MKEELKPVGEPRIPLDMEKIKQFCEKWKIVEFSLFGSVLTEDFRPDSDVDVMVKFAEDATWTLFDMVDIEDDLEQLFGRDVDVMTRGSIEQSRNKYRRASILDSARTIYAS